MKLVIATAIFASISAFSQEIKIKKGELLLDNKAVAKVDDKGRIYKFSDMNGKLQFDATVINGRTIGTQSDNGWIEYTGTNGHVKEANHTEGTFTLSMGKLIVQNAMAQGLITKDGIDEAKVNEFFLTEDRSLSDTRKNGITSQKTEAKNEDDLGISVDFNGNIKNKNGEFLGFITRAYIDASQSQFSSTAMMDKYLEYRVFDINKILIAKLQCSDSDITNESKGLKIYTYNNKEIPMTAKNGMDFKKPLAVDKIADRMVKKLYANGYTLGDMKPVFEGMAKEKNDAINQKKQEAENNAKANSKNIYNTPGYVIDKDGTKKEGSITIEFESIDAKLGREKGMGDLTNYGGTVTLNIEGKNEFFKAKDGIKFCAGEKCFIGVAGTNMFGGSVFSEILSENNGSYVLLDVKTPDDYYLKLANQPKAVYLGEKGGFGKRKPEKIKKVFDEYVSCPALDFSKYDTRTKEGLINVLNDYQSSCKK
ncbi:hypothetical protein [Chryseobacterium lathyri]|uniref:Uncharacterized protein n=1 Tax=Chryseobacterium lathyri TaxID=395933 RepID=A0ABT9SLT3_9FLAO|nr:hypothetical protein [Chryseobacterium lathyri]MDP9960391.1 hypothetical protein [Chryseobacterium lathyri]